MARVLVCRALRVSASLAIVTALSGGPGAGRLEAQTTGAYMIAPASFQPGLQNAGTLVTVNLGDALDANLPIFFVAPVNVPVGSTITRVRFFALDSDGADGIDICLTLRFRPRPLGAASRDLGKKCTTGVTDGIAAFTLRPAARTITADSVLWLHLDFAGANHQFYGARVTYTTP